MNKYGQPEQQKLKYDESTSKSFLWAPLLPEMKLMYKKQNPKAVVNTVENNLNNQYQQEKRFLKFMFGFSKTTCMN